ncbi:SnoaL-like domain-containing protein [Paraburkholderia tropica]|uniref:nuclear transport factor 2 family protein n=1 Tax=Paraburkholderia tropica TaxID=92647 RepID=UPI001CAC95BC|nr:nuclear transport factor 2 family protein [Paraburkholderia tropica]CAG9226935.1 SnoaL-like domain-containing protein [Paraburkholderia tropica]
MSTETETAKSLEELLAIEAIKNVRTRYCHYLDANRMDALAQLFTSDAICEVDRGIWRGRDAIREGLAAAFRAFDTQNRGRYPFLHAIANQWVELLGDDRAEGRCYLIDLVTTRPRTESPFLLLGLYADEYRRVDGQWLISRTRLDVVWPENNGGGGDPGKGLVLPD